MAVGAASDDPTVNKSNAFAFTDLPTETQKEIISHCSQSDLIAVALVSRHFHELASAWLYRNFNIVFPDDDDLNFESPIDGLAGGLDTFTTSDYNYGRHLKDLSLDTLSTGHKAEHAYKSYLYSASCGKFLNTLLYLTLKKAKSLEAFRWNIRVELSRPVYQELHKIQSLTKLHIRLQAGDSYYTTPPPLPIAPETLSGQAPLWNFWAEIPSLSAPTAYPNNFPGNLSNPLLNAGPPPSLMAPSKQASKAKASKRTTAKPEPPTLSGFKKLKTLSVLDIDNLDILTELRNCIKNSSSTLNELHLSLSDALALQARKPPPDSDADDSEVDDEFNAPIVSTNTSFEASVPAKAFRAQEERKLQEAILGKIFGLNPPLAKKPRIQRDVHDASPSDGKGEESEGGNSSNVREEYIESLNKVAKKLMALEFGSHEFTAAQAEMLETIASASKKYLDSEESTNKIAEGSTPSGIDAASAKEVNVQSETKQKLSAELLKEEPCDDPSVTSVPEVQGESSTAGFTTRRTGKMAQGELAPEDIDIEHLDADAYEDSEDQSFKDATEKPDGMFVDSKDISEKPCGSSSKTKLLGISERLTGLEETFESLGSYVADASKADPATLEESFEVPSAVFRDARHEVKQLKEEYNQIQNEMLNGSREDIDQLKQDVADRLESVASIKSPELEESAANVDREPAIGASAREKTQDPLSSSKDVQRRMENYVRETRGLPLETLSIQLIPVKASVLAKAVDLTRLKNLTLLNVGNQATLWTLLASENKTRPLALRSVYTDHVSPQFLSCMRQLDELHELFVLQRSAKHKPESFAPATTCTIDQIRRLVLKPHMHTLKRIMIKDESNGPNWDINQKTMILICSRGSQLEEMAVSMNINAVHAFMQFFPGLASLRALHILRFKNNDTCMWVMREILKFIVDTLSHYPALKLEWIAMEEDHRLHRIIRPTDEPKAAIDGSERNIKKDKGKGKATANTSHLNTAFPMFPVDAWGEESESEEETDDAFDSGKRLRLKTVGPLQFYDAWGVRIFDKEIRSGRL
ncbi:hypothetical protein G7046_g5325 [Stylonectria norvegica]|nr:hypothetical protein G7046_g5325 [Stylonectria norvegica]